MCTINEYTNTVIQHSYNNYQCPQCGKDWCWECNPSDQRGSWHGEQACHACGYVFIEGSFA